MVTILPAEDREDIGTFMVYSGAASLAVLLIASAFAWLISGRVLDPVRRLTDTARSISQSDLTHRIEVSGTGEAADMARSFNAMLDRLESVFRSQREFIQDANHELRDPLTIVRGHLQLLDDDPVERERSIKLVLDELDRMGTIVDDLKLLADVEQPGFLRLERIDVEAFTAELVSKGSALASRDWVVENGAGGTFVGDRHRLTEAVMNLAHNAVQHTVEPTPSRSAPPRARTRCASPCATPAPASPRRTGRRSSVASPEARARTCAIPAAGSAWRS